MLEQALSPVRDAIKWKLLKKSKNARKAERTNRSEWVKSTPDWIPGLLPFNEGAMHRSALITHKTCPANLWMWREMGSFGGDRTSGVCLPSVFSCLLQFK